MSTSVPTSYQPLNNVATTDNYPGGDGASAAYRSCPRCVRANIAVSNAAVYYQLGQLQGGAIVWLPERYLLPSFNSLERAFDAIRFRSAAAGVPALVTADLLTPNDLGA